MNTQYADRRMADSWVMKAHDVRDVSACAYLAAEELSNSCDARTRALGERILSACDRIVDICDASTKKHVEMCQGSVGQTMKLMTELAEFTAGPDTRLHLHVGCDAPITRDGVSLFRILSNLVHNAIAAVNNSGGGSVIIRSIKLYDRVTFFVENSSGITEKPVLQSKGGTGLGLLIASGLAHEIGASLEQVKSCKDGTVYALQLSNCMAPVAAI